MKRLKVMLYCFITVIEAVLIAGTYIVNYFTAKKLGMMRWVNFTCSKWEKMYPITLIKITIITAIIVLVGLAIWIFVKQKKYLKKYVSLMLMVMIALSGICIGYIICLSFQVMRSYYLISIMLVLAVVLQIIKTLIGIKVCRNEE